jgi:signal transduction histidine kinase
VAEVAGKLDATITELRELCRGIHPAILSEGGLGSTSTVLARRFARPG